MFNSIHFSQDAPDQDNITRMDLGALPMIRDMQRVGIRVDITMLRSISQEISELQRGIENEVECYLGGYQYTHPKTGARTPFKIGSRDHLSQLLFEEWRVQGKGAVLELTDSGSRYEVSEEVMKPFVKNHPGVQLIIDWHSANKIKTTYSDPLQAQADADDRIHTKFSPCRAATGRLASSNPNLQNVPTRTELGKQIRYAFLAAPGWKLVSNDLSQIEMVWAAYRSQDPTMLAVFRNGEDIHTRTACNVYGLDYAEVSTKIKLVELKKPYIVSFDGGRTNRITPYEELKAWVILFKQTMRLPCKTVGFGVLYGQTAEGLQKSLASEGVFWTIEDCQEFIDKKFFAVYPWLKIMLEKDYARALRYAMVWCDFGRVRLVPEARSQFKRISQEGIRKAGNHPEQAGAQGTIKVAMAMVQSWIESQHWYRTANELVRPLLQIHDELICEVREDFVEEWAIICGNDLEQATPLVGPDGRRTPIKSSSDTAERWGELK